MRNFSFLVLFPRLDESGSRVVAQIDTAAGRVFEACGSDLPSPYQRHDEPVRQRAQLFRQVERKGGSASPRAVKETHLIVQTDALQRTRTLGHHQSVAEAQHCIDRVSRRSARSCREPQLGCRHDLLQRPEVDPGGIPFDTAYVVARHRIHEPRRSAAESVHCVRRGARCPPRPSRHATSGQRPCGCFAASPQLLTSPDRAIGNRPSPLQRGPYGGGRCPWSPHSPGI